MKRVLIYLNENQLAPTGGANGYNYTLREGLQVVNHDEIKIDYLQGESVVKNVSNKVNKLKKTKSKEFLLASKSILKKGALMYGPVHKSKLDLSVYDAVHFHRTMDMYWVKDSLKKYRGKVVLTLHAPTMPSKQVFSMLTNFEKEHLKWYYSKLPQIDNYAVNRADNIIIACEEAEEPYFHEWPGYCDFRNKNKNKFRYMTTGTSPKKAGITKEEMRDKYNIPKNAFVIAYVGRHNEVKGYDLLKLIGAELLKENKDIYILIAGTEGPLYHLEHERWIEVGWTKDPGSVIQAADVFLLPNKETYFDLVMLEVLSLGQIVAASATGGNKYFSKFGDSGIFLYRDSEEAKAVINKLFSLKDSERDVLREKNKAIYKEEFTETAFAERYIKVLKNILGC